MLRTHEAGTLRADHAGQTVTLTGLGGPAARSRRGGLPRPARRLRRRPGRRARRGARRGRRARPAQRVLRRRSPARSRARPRATRTPTCRPARSRSSPSELEVLNASRAAAVPDRRARRPSARRPASSTATSTCVVRRLAGAAIRLRSRGQRGGPRGARRARLRRDRDADADPVDARGRPRLPRAGPPGARLLVRPAAEPAAVQAAAHGGRHGALLPDRPLLPRRGLPRRPPAGVHPARHRDELRRAGRRASSSARRSSEALWKLIGVELHDAVPADDLRRRDGAATARTSPTCASATSSSSAPTTSRTPPFRVFQAEYVGAVVMPGGASQPRKQLDAWQDWAKQRGAQGLAYVLVQEDGELGGPVAKNLTDAERAGLAAARRRPARRLRLLRRRCHEVVARAARRRPARDRPPLRADRRVARGRSSGSSTRRCSSRPPTPSPPVTSPSAAGAWTAVHHAFTSPKTEFLDTFDTDPGSALAYAYDIVCNGNEIGGGSIRIHRRDVQERVFAVMGLVAGGGAGEVRLPARRLRRSARRRTAASRSAGTASSSLLARHRVDPRRHRLPEVRRRLRPADRGARADHGRAAQGGRRRRQAG